MTPTIERDSAEDILARAADGLGPFLALCRKMLATERPEVFAEATRAVCRRRRPASRGRSPDSVASEAVREDAPVHLRGSGLPFTFPDTSRSTDPTAFRGAGE